MAPELSKQQPMIRPDKIWETVLWYDMLGLFLARYVNLDFRSPGDFWVADIVEVNRIRRIAQMVWDADKLVPKTRGAGWPV